MVREAVQDALKTADQGGMGWNGGSCRPRSVPGPSLRLHRSHERSKKEAGREGAGVPLGSTCSHFCPLYKTHSFAHSAFLPLPLTNRECNPVPPSCRRPAVSAV